MDDWERYRKEFYNIIINQGQYGRLDDRRTAIRVRENKWGVYETPKEYVDGVAFNDGGWLIYNTSRAYKHKDENVYKDSIFCQNKNKVIEDLYSYIMFLRKIGIEIVFEMNYYTIAFLVKYLRFNDKVFDCNAENKKKIVELCQKAFDKEPEEIVCDRKDTREFALDPDMKMKMTTSAKTRMQKKIQKQMTDALIEKWYNKELSIRKNKDALLAHGIDISVGRLHQWIKEYIKE